MKREVSILLLFLLFGSLNAELFGIYQRIFNGDPLTVSILDPHTAIRIGNPVFSSNEIAILFGGSSDIDRDNNVFYFPSLSSNGQTLNSTIIGLDCSNLANIKQVMALEVPFTASIVKYSPKLKKIVVGGPYISPDSASVILASQDPRNAYKEFMMKVSQDNITLIVYVGIIDPQTNKYTPITQLPTDHIFTTVSGSPSTVDYDTNTLYVATIGRSTNGSDLATYMDSVNLDTGVVTSAITDEIGVALTYWNEQVLSISFYQNNQDITSGYFDIHTNKYVDKYTLPDNLQFVITGITAMDVKNEVYYSIIGSGEGPPVALTTISAKNYTVTEYHYFGGNSPQDYDQAQFLFTI